ncbi:hypothetical protein DRQ12_08240 [candidate division KSB1 bacterium]|nr:MAG: hypothetical protein DRQ12_08240 [candidate division KSB1 bacterium]
MTYNKEIPIWIKGLKNDLLSFLENVRCAGPYGRFRYAVEGCLLPHDPISSVYAFGILKTINTYDALEEKKKQQWADYLRSFQDQETGEFWSEEIGGLCRSEEHGLDPKYLMKRMLTRNISNTLQQMGFAPQYPLRYPEVEPFTDKEKLIAHLDSFPWDKNPWGAGSHAGTTVLMLFNRLMRGEEEFRQPLRWAIEYVLEKQDPETGLWGAPTCPLYERINGAFKVIARLIGTLGIVPRYPERIIDNVFKHYEDPSYQMTGCNEFDNIWVFAAALRATDYRKTEIQELVLSRLPFIESFKKQDGGFSFFKEKCITTNAQAQLVDRPRSQSDMVGTATFVSCLRSTFEILGWNGQLGWRGLWDDAPEKPVEL